MIHTVEATLKGSLEIEADDTKQAKEIAEDGFSLSQFNCEDVEIDDIYPTKT